MKRIFTFALGLAAICGASAQSVVIVDNDGVAHKFCTDYVSEITFVDASQPIVETIPMTSLHVDGYSYGNCVLNFAAENIKVVLDTYCGSDATYLLPGEYTVANTGTAMYIGSGISYTFVEKDGIKHAITAGTMNVAREGLTYTFDMEFTLDDKSTFKASYTGELDAYAPVVSFTGNAINQVYINNPAPGKFRLRASGDNPTFEATIDFFSGASATTVADGTYTLASTGEAMTYSAESKIEAFNPNATYHFNGPITVSTDATGVATISSKFTTADGMDVTFTTTAKIEYLED